jgi:hypothetical protein
MPRSPCAALIALTTLALSAGCGRRGELLGTIDSADGGGGSLDGAGDGAASLVPRFMPPQLVTSLSNPIASDEDPTFTGDLLELFFMSTRNGTRDLWTSRRASADVPWGPPAPVMELSSPAADYSPGITLDGLTIWFATDRDLTRGRIWRSARVNRGAFWSPPVPVTELASPSVDVGPVVDATDTLFYFSSNRPGAFGFDLYFATRAVARALWSPPIPVPGVNTPSDELDPFVAQGGLVLFFTSTRAGMGDIFWATRRSTDAPFAPAVPLVDVNSPFFDSDASLSLDLGYMMFSSTRSGNSEIYETWAIR